METRLPPPPDESPDAESDMSFPASDPPSYSQPTVGDAADGPDLAPETGEPGQPDADVEDVRRR
jgi:hypothetical protein